ncbi:TRAP transporter large permease subunit [Ramlibacter ginsenosidimutans]|uniref:TRAP transporter large permease subunit n=1 Tax=Ramlibacter ginsenosidimutans TaxID=502333 RepID=A0A934TNY3_9BURK|nr:TRAP transporter large permease subunit [Ramlibacter ginsenosidimutans]MBK6004826.1 TRAP transporter large permease subunit [Ramlibacter ginsenosidimutans]
MDVTSQHPAPVQARKSAVDRSHRRAHGTDWIERTAEIVVVCALAGELVAMFGNVIARSFFNTSLVWSLEVGELALVVMTFIGGAIAYPRNEHMALHAVVQRLPGRWHPAVEAFATCQVFAMALAGCVLAWQMMLSRWDERTPYLELRAIWFALPMIAGMALLAWFALKRLGLLPRRAVVTGAIATAIPLAILLGLAHVLGADARAYALPAAFAVFAVQLVLGVPIGFALLMVTLLYLSTANMVPLSVVPINLQAGISSFVMLSIPFFILAGYVMTEGGLSRRMTEFVTTLVGRFRGGMLQVIVVCMYIMSGISGSKVADVAAVGTTMKDVMRKERYDAGETAAVLASCAIMGETVPPSIAMLVLASVTSLSIGTLFVAGLLPAAVIAACLMVLIYLRSRDRAGTTHAATMREIWRSGVVAIPALVAPVILIGGIVSGIATPTEVSSTAVVYALLLAIVVYRALSPKALWHTLVNTAAQAGMVLFITSTASTFSWSLTLAKMPQQIAALFARMNGSSTAFMLATLVTLIVMGALLEGLPALLIFGPLLLPLTSAFGIDPLQYGIVMIIAMGFGAFSPPIGVGMFVTCSICETTMENAAKHMAPYLAVLIVGLLLVAFVPWFSLVVPKVLGML